ncbi:MAG: class I SAM-dependent methyltransferase [Nitrosospira sp.]|nr:class I SAM-dependent methyltransferase [Nitrosospira sp.]
MDLTQREAHFEFGKNWLSFLDRVDDSRIEDAIGAMQKRLFPNGELQGKHFLDIGCGSGLSMLAALNLGAARVTGVDIDEYSVEATRQCLGRYAAKAAWDARQASVFDLDPDKMGRFDVVHSWGVLHHTGDMWTAVDKAAALVADDGLLALALYARTPFCGIWHAEKRFYSSMPMFIQNPMRWLWESFCISYSLAGGNNPIAGIRNYRGRGMSWSHDQHDWLGGYPYESTGPAEVHAKMSALGFTLIRENVQQYTKRNSIFGSGCNEYVYRRDKNEIFAHRGEIAT